MKKILSIALICALGLGSFTSCVKTDESASVTNIRNQKAEQLKSMAALNNAEAEAKKTLAEAKAKLLAAEAAYQQALADGEKLNNEEQQILIDKAKATLELEIKAAKLNAEAAVKRAEAAFELAKASLIAAMDQVSEAEKTRINTLIGKAGMVLSDLNNEKQNLVTIQSSKVAVEYELIDVKRGKEDAIRNNNYSIASYKATLAELEKMSTADKDAAKKAMDEANAKLEKLNITNGDALSKYNAAYGEYTTAQRNMNDSKFATYARRHSQYITNKYVDGKTVEFSYEDGTYGSIYAYGYETYTVNTKALEDAIANYEKLVTVATTRVTEGEKALTEKMKTQTYKDAVKALEDAEKAFTDAKTANEKEIARINVENAKWNLKQVTANEVLTIENANNDLKNNQFNLKEIKEVKVVLTGDDAKKYQELLKIYEGAHEKRLNASLLKSKTSHNVMVQSNLYYAYNDIYSNLTDFPALISQYKGFITNLEKDNADYLNINTKEALIAKYASEIAALETQIKILEKQYNDYQAQIDALVKAL